MVTIAVKVVPGASRDRVAGRYGEGIKIHTSAAPEAGKANAAVTKILAQFLMVDVLSVELISGSANPHKMFRITGLSSDEMAQKLSVLK